MLEYEKIADKITKSSSFLALMNNYYNTHNGFDSGSSVHWLCHLFSTLKIIN